MTEPSHGRSAKKFQSTRPRGARPGHPAFLRMLRQVSIHAPAWGATATRWPRLQPRSCFNPRARVGRDGLVCIDADRYMPFQSTRPRGARRLGGPKLGRVRVVSIHAPAWGATTTPSRPLTRDQVSIHAPAWGATAHRARRASLRACFNPRARVGRDARTHATDDDAGACVSIHAPAWGATASGLPDAAMALLGFNPRARVGRDLHLTSDDPSSDAFQSTRPRGARHIRHR